jgi:hypothetical protein
LVAAKVRERLAVTKGTAQKIKTKRFNLKKLNEGDLKHHYQVQSETSLQLWKTQRTLGTSTGHGTILGRTSTFRPKRD